MRRFQAVIVYPDGNYRDMFFRQEETPILDKEIDIYDPALNWRRYELYELHGHGEKILIDQVDFGAGSSDSDAPS